MKTSISEEMNAYWREIFTKAERFYAVLLEEIFDCIDYKKWNVSTLELIVNEIPLLRLKSEELFLNLILDQVEDIDIKNKIFRFCKHRNNHILKLENHFS